MESQSLWVALASSVVAIGALALNAYGMREARLKSLMEKRWDRRADAYLSALKYIGIGATSRSEKVHYYDLRAPIRAFGSGRVASMFDAYVEAFDGVNRSSLRADELERALEIVMNEELMEGTSVLA